MQESRDGGEPNPAVDDAGAARRILFYPALLREQKKVVTVAAKTVRKRWQGQLLCRD